MKPALLIGFLMMVMSGRAQSRIPEQTLLSLKAEKNKSLVVLFPNPSSTGKVRIRSGAANPLNFFLFDLEGQLIQQIQLLPKEEKEVTGLRKGTYLYQFLDKDHTVEKGKLLIK